MSKNRHDFGESFVEKERQFRFRKNLVSLRAKSEVGGAIRQKNVRTKGLAEPNYHMNASFQNEIPSYPRPKSSFEPASLSRVFKNRGDDWCEIERRYISNNSSDEDRNSDLEHDDDDSREEMISYNFRSLDTSSLRNSNSYNNFRNSKYSRNTDRKFLEFDEREIYYFGVIQLSPEKAHSILSINPPPLEYRMLTPVQRTAYLYYYTLYRKYLTPVDVFHRVFNREFYKYTCDGDSDDLALWKICKHTHEEYKRHMLKKNQNAYKLSQKRLFSDERDSPDSRNSERQSFCDHESDINSIESSSREPLLYTRPHATISFATGGQLVYLDPEFSVSTIRIEDVKNYCLDRTSLRHIEALEGFKGPLIIGQTQPQTPLLFIQRQIDRIHRSDVYCANPSSGDANDCLLIWNLLEVLVRQQGKVTGPDLARLLVANYSYSSFLPQSYTNDTSSQISDPINSDNYFLKNEHKVDVKSMDKFTHYLLGGHVEEAIESAIQDGLLFDALFLAHRIFRNDQKKLNEIEAKLLRFRKPQHPVMTLMSVAGESAVPLLTNTTTDDANGWRAHIAIVLANLQTPAAISTVFQMGLALAQKEFNSAADFCFLAVNLLTSYDCFSPPVDTAISDDTTNRNYIKLINASLPDDDLHSTNCKFGWSILDFQATEIFDYALKLRNASGFSSSEPTLTCLSHSLEFQKCRFKYATLMSDYGGFNSNVFSYCVDVARSVWNYVNDFDPLFTLELCNFAERFQHIANCDPNQQFWISSLKEGIPLQLQSRTFQKTNRKLGVVNQSEEPVSLPINVKPISPTLEVDDQVEKPATDYKESENIVQNFVQTKMLIENHQPPPTSFQNEFSLPSPPTEKYYQNEPEIKFKASDTIEYQQQYSVENKLTNIAFAASTEHVEDNESNEPPIDFNSFYNVKSVHNDSLFMHLPVPPQIDLDHSKSFATSSVSPNLQKQFNGNDDNDSMFNDTLANPKLIDDNHLNMSSLGEISETTNVSGGLFSGLKNRLVKIIPSNNAMILPNDSNPEIRWDEKLQRYVGDGVENEVAPPPPPVINSVLLPSQNMLQQQQPKQSTIHPGNPEPNSSFAKPRDGSNSLGRRRRYHNPGYFS